MTTFIGLALSDSMFSNLPAGALLERRQITAAGVRERLAKGAVSCCNPSHRATLAALKVRFDLDVPVPERAPKVSLGLGDSAIIMQITGLPRLGGDRHEYTESEVAQANFTFAVWDVWSQEELTRLGASTFYGW